MTEFAFRFREDSLKIKTICFVSLLMVIGSVAMAQQIGPCTRLTRTLVVDWPKFHSDVCKGYNPNEFILSPNTVGNPCGGLEGGSGR